MNANDAAAIAFWNAERDNPGRVIWAPWGMLDDESKDWCRQQVETAIAPRQQNSEGK